MQSSVPSRSALRVALRRAAHQLFDEPPLVFSDPLAVPILATHAAELGRTPGRELGRRKGERARVHSFSLRAFLVVRSRYAEDRLAAAVRCGTGQYVLLGAGLDTFAWRNPFPELRVFELDHPATQAWKRQQLAAAGLSLPENLTLVPLDLESSGDPGAALAAAGLRAHEPAFFSCLGVAPYLTAGAFDRMLRLLATQARGSGAVFDYTQPRHEHAGFDQLAHGSMAARLRATGEPFRQHHSPAELHSLLEARGLSVCEDLGAAELNARYFDGRTDGLRVLASAGRIVSLATLAAPDQVFCNE